MSQRTRKFGGGAYYSLYVVKGKGESQEIAQYFRNRQFFVRITPGSPKGYWEIWAKAKTR